MSSTAATDVWLLERWKDVLPENRRTGLRLRFDASVDSEVRTACLNFAAGDYAELFAKSGRDNALCAILTCFAHELTHYFQWINALSLTERGRERQAPVYAHRILDLYSQTRDHP